MDLCSDEDSKPKSIPVSALQKSEVVLTSETGAVKTESKVENVLQEPHLASGIVTQQRLPSGELQKNRGKKRKRKQRDKRRHDPEKFDDDDQLAALRAGVEEAEREVEHFQQGLRQADCRLKSLKDRLASRLKFLHRQADKNFNWMTNFPWDSRLYHQLNHVFRLTSFRPLQHEALNATLLKRDVFSILPTGAGKSLIYQLAAVVDGGLTLVITPLLSLSMDQRMSLEQLGIRSASIDSVTNRSNIKKIYDEFLPSNGKVPGSRHPRKRKMRGRGWIRDDMKPAILFVTPEQIARSKRLMQRLEGMHENSHLSRICIDEAHCASLWGHDFRSEYRKLGMLRRQLPDAPILALTATCSEETTEDVCKMLETRDCVTFRGSIDRPNLFYEVREKRSDEAAVLHDLVRWIRGEFEGMCGIIYVLAKKDAFNYASSLQEAGIHAGCYHGDLEHEERNEIHSAWSDGRVQVVVATIAFGLGIDNPHVRFIIHATMATSLEAYYQESGRAGRDGKPAKCIVLHRAKEFPKMSGFVADKGAERLRKMHEMYQYASSRGLEKVCRRAVIAKSFGEVPPVREDKASCCDVCAARERGTFDRVVVDVTDLAQSVGRIVLMGATARPDEKVTLIGVASDWGNTGAKGKRARGDEKAIPRQVCMDTRLEILVELIHLNILKEYHRHSSYAINAYVTFGKAIEQVFDGLHVRIVVTKENAMKLVMAGCKITGGIGDWNSHGNEQAAIQDGMDGMDGGSDSGDILIESGHAGEELHRCQPSGQDDSLKESGVKTEDFVELWEEGKEEFEEVEEVKDSGLKDEAKVVDISIVRDSNSNRDINSELAIENDYQDEGDGDGESDGEAVRRKRTRR